MEVGSGMRVISSFILSVWCVVSVATVHGAWPFSDKAEGGAKKSGPVAKSRTLGDAPSEEATFVRRAHLRFEDPQMEKDFLTLVATRDRTREDLKVISRLIAEKENEVARFAKELGDDFHVKPDGSYRFDAESHTLYELVPKKPGEAEAMASSDDWEKAYDRRALRRLDEEQRKRFFELATAKQLSSDQLRALRLLKNEKHIEEARIQQELTRKFAISNDRNYQYDADTKNLFELVPVPLTNDEVNDKVAKEAVRR